MDANDFAKLAGINPTRKATVDVLPDAARQMAMLAGLVPASGRSALAENQLIPDAGLVENADIEHSDESFLATMSRAAGINPAMIEEGVDLDINAVPVPAPPVFEAPAGYEIVEDATPIPATSPVVASSFHSHQTVRTIYSTPKWAYDLRTAVEGLIDKSLAPKDALKAMQEAIKVSYVELEREEIAIEEPLTTESEEERMWKSFYRKSLQD